MESTDDHTHQPAINVELKTAEILEIFDRQVFNQFKKAVLKEFLDSLISSTESTKATRRLKLITKTN